MITKAEYGALPKSCLLLFDTSEQVPHLTAELGNSATDLTAFKMRITHAYTTYFA
jgi:hypothetical protein